MDEENKDIIEAGTNATSGIIMDMDNIDINEFKTNASNNLNLDDYNVNIIAPEPNLTSESESTKNTHFINCIPKLVNVLYPGYVNDVDKAIQNLGGIKNIEAVTTADKKHLELRFRPNNLCSKPVISDRDTKPQLLLKVKIRKGIQDEKVVSTEVLDYDVVGLTAVNIKFTKLCDFQYLPLVSKVPKEVEEDLTYIYEDIVPQKLVDHTDTERIFNYEELDPAPLYFVPYYFSKPNLHGNRLQFDRSTFYEGRFLKQYCDNFKKTQQQQKMMRSDRDKFTKTTMLIRIEDDVPQQPNAQAVRVLKDKGFSATIVNKIKELFEQRPIWSRNALFYCSRATTEQMKFILPTIAYHYVSGPWRIMWVRFGYDPKADPSAKLLQTFDYRIKSRETKSKIKIRTERYAPQANGKQAEHSSKFKLSNAVSFESKSKAVIITENYFILKPGFLPASRQTFFQYCDVKLPDIENMIAKLPAVFPGSRCDLKHGWLPNGFADQCREMVNKYVNEMMATEMRNLRKEKETSDSELSSSDSEISDGEVGMDTAERDDVIDLETVEEISDLIGVKKDEAKSEIDYEQPGPSSAC